MPLPASVRSVAAVPPVMSTALRLSVPPAVLMMASVVGARAEASVPPPAMATPPPLVSVLKSAPLVTVNVTPLLMVNVWATLPDSVSELIVVDGHRVAARQFDVVAGRGRADQRVVGGAARLALADAAIRNDAVGGIADYRWRSRRDRGIRQRLVLFGSAGAGQRRGAEGEHGCCRWCPVRCR